MKKLFLCAAVAVFGLANVNAQDFKLGVSAAAPIGDAGDISSFGIIVEAAYLFEVSDEFRVGPSVGYNHSFGKDGFKDFSWLPIAAAARYLVSDEFTLGVDLGYAVGISPSGVDGGFSYAPKVQYGFSDTIDIVLAYRGMSINSLTWSQITLGVEFRL